MPLASPAAQPALTVMRRWHATAPIVARLCLRRRRPGLVACAAPCLESTARRCLSQQASRWLDKLRYGADDAPALGSWESAYEDDAMDTRKLYCKALVHASGGSRLARDWIAGCAALTSPDPSLIYTALQHDATEADVQELREHFLHRLLAHNKDANVSGDRDVDGEEREEDEEEQESEVVPPNEQLADAPAVNADGADAAACSSSPAAPPSPEAVREAEHLLLQHSAEVRCFMYDAMTASLFHSNNDLRTVEAARRHTFGIGAALFGLTYDDLAALWRVVEAELLLKKEKIKVLGQPWGE